MTVRSIAIIGAGVAGLACAQRLTSARVSVRVFDKGRSPGGRVSTRRVNLPSGVAQFDHGAQYVTARDPDFTSLISAMIDRQAVAEWSPPGAASGAEPAWVGSPSMSAFPKALAAGLDIECAARVASIDRRADGWTLSVERADQRIAAEGPFSDIVLAAPPEQTLALLGDAAPDLAGLAATARMAPCWAVLAGFTAQRSADAATAPSPPRPDGYSRAPTNGSPIAWLAHDSGKHARPSGPTALDCWVIHASAEWSRLHLVEDAAKIGETLLEAARAFMPHTDPPTYLAAHRWRYARVEHPVGQSFGWSPDRRIGSCGDWWIGPRVEAAWLSGRRLAEAMLT
ncbi:NAD(P)-binding protein [bacterium]|nr:NAD(P)-binding protein [bacterium]